MTEYWKSTPKYWCKFCSTYVRDTGIERKNHESTGRHQSAIQRSLRTLHKDKEREERDKQRAKDEVARLKGSSASASATDPPWKKKASIASGANAAPPKTVTLEEWKRQMHQLADMGVAIPEEYRKDMAMAGEWRTVSVAAPVPVQDANYKAEDESKSRGIRKRKLEGEDEAEDESAFGEKKSKVWGSTLRSYPSAKKDVDYADEIDALLGGGGSSRVKQEAEPKAEEAEERKVKIEDGDEQTGNALGNASGITKVEQDVELKHESGEQVVSETLVTAPEATPNVVFKKRKKKN